MKIAIINRYQDKVARGAETFVAELSKRLSKNHDVTVLKSVDFKNKYDLIIPINGRFQVFLVKILALLRGSKVIVSGQSGIGLDDRVNLYSFPNIFVALSSYQEKWAKRINPFVKVVKISNGVDNQKFKSTEEIDFGLPGKIILNVAALTENKRQDLLIKAMAKLKNASLVLIGKGEKEQYLRDLANKLIPGRFKILNFAHNEMPKVYKSVDVFTFPTVSWESFGIAMVEAMASGLPVVASKDPIRQEIIGDAGILINPSDIDEYAKALQNAIDLKWGDKPVKQAKKFDWDDIAFQYEALIKTL